jgi:4-hydroxybenzoate polyprenyltransferase
VDDAVGSHGATCDATEDTHQGAIIMARIPRWIYIMFGLLALLTGILGVIHAPSGVPKIFWAVICVLGAASLLAALSCRGQRTQ